MQKKEISNQIIEEKCKVVFVGAGYMTVEHIKAFSKISSAELCGIFSRTKTRAEKISAQYEGLLVCNSISELYDTTKADLVVISVPELSTNEVCKEASKFPWVCLVEKPVGYNLDDAGIILKYFKNNNAYVALNRRYYSSTKNVLNKIAEVEGQRVIHVFDQEDQIAARKAHQPELVVLNWMYANSIHIIDYLRLFGRGNIVSVENIIPWNPDNPSFVMAKIIFDSGDIGIYEAIWNAPGPWSVSINAGNTRWEMRPLEQASVQLYGSRSLVNTDISDKDINFKPGLYVQAEEAIKAARGLSHSLPSLNEAMESMKLISEIYREET